MVETAKIPDFAPLIKAGTHTGSSLHKLVHTHPFNGKELLFLSNPSHHIFEGDEAPISLQELIEFAKSEEGSGIYEHKW